MRRQRASVYQRHVLNEFASSSSQYVELTAWDKCVDHALGRLPPNPNLPVWAGVDCGYKHDQTAIVAVTFDRSQRQVRLVDHRVFQPTSAQPLDFELTIESYLLDLARRFRVRQILFDPWQMQATAQRLTRAGLPLREFAQSSPNLTAASQCLFDLIQSQSLALYPNAAMRLAISRAVAIEGPRGWRIGKDKSAFKIDIVVALAMAAHAAVQEGQAGGLSIISESAWRQILHDIEMMPRRKIPGDPPPPPRRPGVFHQPSYPASWRRGM